MSVHVLFQTTEQIVRTVPACGSAFLRDDTDLSRTAFSEKLFSQRLPVWMEKVPLTCLMPGIEGGVRSGLTGEVQYAVNGPWDLGRRVHLLHCGEGTACFPDQRGSFPNSVFNMCFRSSEFNQIVQSTFGDRLEVPAHLRSHPGCGFCERQEPAFGIRPCFILFKKFSKKTVSH